jgi:hypothetical protein
MCKVDEVIKEYRKTARRNEIEQVIATAAMCITCGAFGGVIALRLAGVH